MASLQEEFKRFKKDSNFGSTLAIIGIILYFAASFVLRHDPPYDWIPVFNAAIPVAAFLFGFGVRYLLISRFNYLDAKVDAVLRNQETINRNLMELGQSVEELKNK